MVAGTAGGTASAARPTARAPRAGRSSAPGPAPSPPRAPAPRLARRRPALAPGRAAAPRRRPRAARRPSAAATARRAAGRRSGPSAGSRSGSSARAPSIASRTCSRSRSSSLPGTRPGLAGAEVQQRDDRLDSTSSTRSCASSRLVGGAQLLLGGLAALRRSGVSGWSVMAWHLGASWCVGLRGLARRTRRRPPAASRRRRSRARWRWAPLSSGKARLDAELGAHRRGPVPAAARSPRRAGYSSPALEVDHAPVAGPKRIARHRFSSISRRARVARTGTPSSTSRAACSDAGDDQRGERLGLAGGAPARRRCAPRPCRTRGAGAPTTRPACTRRSSSVRDEQLEVVAVGRPAAEGVGDAAAREASW